MLIVIIFKFSRMFCWSWKDIVVIKVVAKMFTLELLECKDKDRFNDSNLKNYVESI